MSLPTTSPARLSRPLLQTITSSASSSSSSSSRFSSISLLPSPSNPSSPCPSSSAHRLFSTTSPAASKPRKSRVSQDPMALRNMPKFQYDDVPTLGHQILDRKRMMLNHLRTVEFEVPKLEALRQPFTPPSASSFLRFRFQHYQGEAHPVSRKAVLAVPIRALFASSHLASSAARHKFLLLAGERFRRSHPVRPSRPETADTVDGEVVISCERMPSLRQNVRWCLDTLVRLVEEANQPTPDLSDVPLDPRADLTREAKKRSYERKDKPKIRDFPVEWLPTRSSGSAV